MSWRALNAHAARGPSNFTARSRSSTAQRCTARVGSPIALEVYGAIGESHSFVTRNQEGLSAFDGRLFAMEPDFIKYAEVTPDNAARVLSPVQFLTWILTSFATIEEVKQHAHEVVVQPFPTSCFEITAHRFTSFHRFTDACSHSERPAALHLSQPATCRLC